MKTPIRGISISLPHLLALRASAKNIDLNRKRVATCERGVYLSGLRGRGMEFAETRPYQVGDDARHIDWGVTARSGRLHTKLYHEERERPVFFLVDYSPSMFFATRVAFKSVIAAQVAALLAWAAAARGDRIGSVIFSGQTQIELPAKSGQRGVLPMLQALADVTQPLSSAPTSGLTAVLTRAIRIARPGSLIFILSDFYDFKQEHAQQIKQLAQHCDIVAGFIFDPLECTPPPPNQYTVSDGSKKLAIDTTNAHFCHAYQNDFLQRQMQLQQVFRQQRMHLLEFVTDQPVVASLQQQWKI